jgi:septum formation protein
MKRLKVPFLTSAPLADEDQLKSQWMKQPGPKDPLKLAEMLALAKAQSLQDLHPSQWIVGSDQLINLDGAILGKQASFETAVAQLQRLSGRTHQLITAVALCKKGQSPICFTDITHITFLPLDEEEIKAYVSLEKPYDCSGSYKVESLGVRLMESIQTQDPTAIIGLPLIRLSKELRKLGYRLDPNPMA